MKSNYILMLALLGGAGCGSDTNTTGADDAGVAPDAAPAADPAALVLTLGAGQVEGIRAEEIREFLGIPYAKPPVGSLRFMPPEPAEAWQGTLDASQFGPACVQPDKLTAPPGERGEDCLTLNVFAPDAADEPRAVMVFIHGGGFTTGGSSLYAGQKLAQEGGVIVVTLNYRLGPLGFFSHPDLDLERAGVPSGNDGLRDQRLALQWVHDNIATFGGDPGRVTVFGESAGAISTCALFVSPTDHALAQRFIVQSGACTSVLGMSTREQSRALGVDLADTVCTGASDVLGCLRDQDPAVLASWAGDRTFLGAGWAPSYGDGDPLLPAMPLELITRGEHNPGELIVGTNKNEWGFFVLYTGPKVSTTNDLTAALAKNLPAYSGATQAVLNHYAPTDATAAETYVRVLTDAAFRCPARTLARAAAKQGNKTYLYSFEQGVAYHAYELPYVFGKPNALLQAPNVDPLHASFAAYWTTFAKAGDPNADGQAEWALYTAEGDAHMKLIDPPMAGSGLATADCDFWDALVAK